MRQSCCFTVQYTQLAMLFPLCPQCRLARAYNMSTQASRVAFWFSVTSASQASLSPKHSAFKLKDNCCIKTEKFTLSPIMEMLWTHRSSVWITCWQSTFSFKVWIDACFGESYCVAVCVSDQLLPELLCLQLGKPKRALHWLWQRRMSWDMFVSILTCVAFVAAMFLRTCLYS